MGMLSTLDDNSLPPDKQQDAETPVYLKFKALIYVHPEICAQLGKTLASANPSSPTFRILSRALGAVAHPQAQSALVEAIKAHPLGGDAQAGLIATLGGSPSPTAEAEKAVHLLAVGSPDPNVSSAAILALGSMAKNLARKEPKRSAEIVDFLAHWADTSHFEEQRQHLLQALGNTASSRAMPLLSRYAADRSPVLRASAVDAMRFIELPQVDGLLLHTLGSDKDAHVRLEAAFALGYRKPDQQSYAAQKKALAADEDEKVRAALLTNLAKMSKQFPDVRTLLKNAATDDPSDYVRQVATGLLQQMGG